MMTLGVEGRVDIIHCTEGKSILIILVVSAQRGRVFPILAIVGDDDDVPQKEGAPGAVALSFCGNDYKLRSTYYQ